MPITEYLLDNAWQQQRQRLAGLEAWFDPGTIRHLEEVGVREGWRCLEIGAGGGSIARWLARRHNLLTDELPEESFDLAHARFVSEHLPDRMSALRQMVHA